MASCALISFEMRHRYDTRGIVLSRSPLGEANTLVTILTPELGLVRARAQGLRRPGAKLAPALTTFAESDLILLRGKEGWRVAGGILAENWFMRIHDRKCRVRAARLSGLLTRLVAGEAPDADLFPVLQGFFRALSTVEEAAHESAEILAALYILSTLGFDAGDLPSATREFSSEALTRAAAERTLFIARINRGIEASGL